MEDNEGQGGWIYYTLLSGVRTVLIEADGTALRSRPDPAAPVVAEAQAGVIARHVPAHYEHEATEVGRLMTVRQLRAALPRELDELEREFPLTAAEFASWKPTWDESCARPFADLDVPPARIRQMAALIPAARIPPERGR